MATTNQYVPPLKPGILSSELWYSLLVTGAGIAETSGFLTPGMADDFTKAIIAIVGGITTLIPIIYYIYNRFVLKKVQLSQAVVVPDSLSSNGVAQPDSQIPAMIPVQS